MLDPVQYEFLFLFTTLADPKPELGAGAGSRSRNFDIPAPAPVPTKVPVPCGSGSGSTTLIFKGRTSPNSEPNFSSAMSFSTLAVRYRYLMSENYTSLLPIFLLCFKQCCGTVPLPRFRYRFPNFFSTVPVPVQAPVPVPTLKF
jgi:hypothetical protein